MALTRLALLLLLGFAVASACGGDPTPGGTESVGGKLKVVTTVSPITSIVENIGGTRIRLEGIVPEGVDSHTFEPRPSVAKTMAEADLIVLNGLFLEQPSLDMAESNKRSDTRILLLGDNTLTREEWKFDFSFPESEGNPNPHLWPDPYLALRYAELVKEELSELDPDGAQYYTSNYEKFESRITDLVLGIFIAVESIPPDNRKLLTYHDSWAYFAQRFGMSVVGAIQPSDFSEPSVREVADLIDQVKELGLPAVFGSEVFFSPVLEQVAKEGRARFIDQLRDDDLPGKPGDPRHSYLGLMLQNMEVMVPALGGNPDSLAGFDPRPVFEGESRAIYPQ